MVKSLYNINIQNFFLVSKIVESFAVNDWLKSVISRQHLYCQF